MTDQSHAELSLPKHLNSSSWGGDSTLTQKENISLFFHSQNMASHLKGSGLDSSNILDSDLNVASLLPHIIFVCLKDRADS